MENSSMSWLKSDCGVVIFFEATWKKRAENQRQRAKLRMAKG